MKTADYVQGEACIATGAATEQRLDALFELDRWADVVRQAAPLMVQSPEPMVFALVAHAHWALKDWGPVVACCSTARRVAAKPILHGPLLGRVAQRSSTWASTIC